MFGQDGEPRATQREDEAGAAGVDALVVGDVRHGRGYYGVVLSVP